jgi:DNA repair protein RadA/Sms
MLFIGKNLVSIHLSMKLKTVYICNSCSQQYPKWQGKCDSCGGWNTLHEETINIGKPVVGNTAIKINTSDKLVPVSIKEVLKDVAGSKAARVHSFSTDILNNFWGGKSEFNDTIQTKGGVVAGGYTLLAGEPGIGKSTFSLQILRALYNGSKIPPKLLYITAEESTQELARRSKRLNIPEEILLVQSNNFEQIYKILNSTDLDVVIVDSVQTISTDEVSSNPGSVSQVSTIASKLLALSKAKNISIILIGHVTKDGQIAGPKTLEHLVDAVLYLQSEDSPHYRTLSFSKNRFGTTSQLLLLKMEPTGLEIVTDPSLALLENLEEGIGVVYGMGLDKDLPLVVEIQALVGNEQFSEKAFGKREAIGFKSARLNTILAIADKYLSISLKNRDVFVQVTGLPKRTEDDSMDLPILLAILSSLTNKPIGQIIKSNEKKLIFAGRLTLSGSIRKATKLEKRQEIATKLKFAYNQGIDDGDITKIII